MTAYRSGSAVRRVGLVAGGYVGAGWAAFLLSRGLEVRVYMRRPEAADQLRSSVQAMWPDLAQIGLAADADPSRLIVLPSLDATLDGCDFVQENAPENPALKAKLYQEIDAAVPADVLIASSTSSLSITDMQAQCTHPQRCVLGHPFTPTHLMRLVEVVGGAQTDPAAVDAAIRTYDEWGKKPVRLNREIFGHIGNRLASALWREAVNLLLEGVASVEDIDKALVEGPGRKWAVAGPFESYHLSGGKGGMSRFLESYSAGIQRRWDDLGAPRLDDDTKDRIASLVEQCFSRAPVTEREARRGALLVAMMRALDTQDPHMPHAMP